MSWGDLRLRRSRNVAGDLVVRFGVVLLDAYLEFLAVRSRPNTVVAVGYDLKVFFTAVGKPPRRVVAADVLAFVTAQYAGGPARRLQVAGAGGVSARTVRRRLSSVSGLTERVPAGPGPWAPGVIALLRHLEQLGFEGAPRIVGSYAADGRLAVTYVPGKSPHPRAWSDEAVGRIGELLRRLHTATTSFAAPADAVWQHVRLRDFTGEKQVIGSVGKPWVL